MAATGVNAAPGHPGAKVALALAIVALALAFYGSFLGEKHLAFSPLNEARNEPGLGITRTSKIARYSLQAVAYFAPLQVWLEKENKKAHK